MCQLGCVDPDPEPDGAGIFLGEAITAQYCLGSGGTDLDGDGLRDFCEKLLSQAFAPELRYSIDDDIRGEPYWAARKVNNNTVRIAYLFSYYQDFGAINPTACRAEVTSFIWVFFGVPAVFGLDPDEVCNPHNGDSEYVVFDVYYEGESGHWVLGDAWYARHNWVRHFYRTGGAAPDELTYPANYGGYPVVWVARRKHASYESQSACDEGGPLIAGIITPPEDACDGTYLSKRLPWSNYWNLGSTAHHLNGLDCVQSRDPTYEYSGQGRQECYWSVQSFRGWVPNSIGGGQAGKYGEILMPHGF